VSLAFLFVRSPDLSDFGSHLLSEEVLDRGPRSVRHRSFFILHDILFPALVARQFSASHSFMRRYDCPTLFQHVLGSPADPLINVWALDVPDVRVIPDVCIHVVSFPGPGRCG
jgi:hypothetical protein